MQTATVTASNSGNFSDHTYNEMRSHIQNRFRWNTASGRLPVFTTDVAGLWEAYLDSFPPESRQHHNCNACRHFIQRYGGLVTVADDGSTAPMIWHEDDATGGYLDAIREMAKLVRRAKVTGVFLSPLEEWGTAVTGDWTHFAVRPHGQMVFKSLTNTAGQAMAEKREDFKNVMRALEEFSLQTLAQAVSLLKSEALYRSEKVLGPAQWLHDTLVARDARHGTRRANVVWRAVATAPAGFCHPRSSIVGTLLDDIQSGMAFADASRRFAEKMHPLQYQRPQAPPAAGNIAQAEKLIQQLGAAGALARRFARLDEIETIWKPQPEKAETAGGVFGHLKPKESAGPPRMSLPVQVMTWEKFARTVLPKAARMQVMAPAVGNYCALVTAANPEAPPIVQWDRDERRNPVTWYVYSGGSRAMQWGLYANGLCPVTAVTLQPSMWHDGKFAHYGEGVILILKGAKDSKSNDAGGALFPEFLKTELRAVRATIEAYSRSAKIAGEEDATANGIRLQKGVPFGNVRMVVTSVDGMRSEYSLDRWD